jgi:hypothetical protein
VSREGAVGIVCILRDWAEDQNAPDGMVGPPDGMNWASVARRCGYRGDDATRLFGMLVSRRLLDQDGIVHDWPLHAPDAVHMRLARAGKRFACGCTPSLSRLAKTLRMHLLQDGWQEAVCDRHGDTLSGLLETDPKDGVRTPCAHYAHGNPSKPNQTEPNQTEPKERDGPPHSAPDALHTVRFHVIGKDAPDSWQAPMSMIVEMRAAFPGTDVDGELRKAAAKIASRCVTAKTVRGMPRFLWAWLERTANSQRSRPADSAPALPTSPAVEDYARQYRECCRRGDDAAKRRLRVKVNDTIGPWAWDQVLAEAGRQTERAKG